MTPPFVRIQHSRGYLKLRLPSFFEKAPLSDIRKIMKLLEKYPLLNEAAHKTLTQFLPAWGANLRGVLDSAAAGQKTAEQLKREAHIRVAFSAEVTYEMQKDLKAKTKSLNIAAGAASRAKTTLERCNKIMGEYKTIKA